MDERTEDKLKSEIYEKVREFCKPDSFFVKGIALEEIKGEFSDIDGDIICDLLNELVFRDEKLIILDRGIITEYIPREKLAEIKKEDKKEKKIKDELKSEIYEAVKNFLV